LRPELFVADAEKKGVKRGNAPFVPSKCADTTRARWRIALDPPPQAGRGAPPRAPMVTDVQSHIERGRVCPGTPEHLAPRPPATSAGRGVACPLAPLRPLEGWVPPRALRPRCPPLGAGPPRGSTWAAPPKASSCPHCGAQGARWGRGRLPHPPDLPCGTRPGRWQWTQASPQGPAASAAPPGPRPPCPRGRPPCHEPDLRTRGRVERGAGAGAGRGAGALKGSVVRRWLPRRCTGTLDPDAPAAPSTWTTRGPRWTRALAGPPLP
jgi:hypothetical protein